MDSAEAGDTVAASSATTVVFKKRGNVNRGGAVRKRKADNEAEDEGNEINRLQIQKNQPRKQEEDGSYIVGGAATAVFESTREGVAHKYGGDATHYSEIDTAIDRDARAVAEKNLKLAAENGDGFYRGLGAYKSYSGKDNATTNASGTVGPTRAPSFLRSINRFDYQPAICKDYKETGFCGFGDSCIYMHDRGDYKSGWQLEKEWEEVQAKKKRKLQMEEAAARKFADAVEGVYTTTENADDDEVDYTILGETDLPFACFICREDFKNPVVTTCGHYFCRDCAINHNKTDPKCKACGKQTFGVFNRSMKLEKKLAAANKLIVTKSTATIQEKANLGSWEEV